MPGGCGADHDSISAVSGLRWRGLFAGCRQWYGPVMHLSARLGFTKVGILDRSRLRRGLWGTACTMGVGTALLGRALGGVIPGVFPTGVSDLREPLAAGSADPHWVLASSADPAFPGPIARVVNEGFPIPPWIDNDTGSKWIGPRADAGSGAAPGNYTYQLRFSLDGFEPDTAVLAGRWATDNGGVEVRLNGQVVLGPNDGGFVQFSPPFEIRTGFAEGENVLEFVLNNAGGDANPTGFRAELAGTAEPVVASDTPPLIRLEPVDASVEPGSPASFSVSARGGRPLRYQWLFNGFPLSRSTNSTLVVPSVSESWVGDYSVVVGNAWGSVTSRLARLSLGFRTEEARLEEPAGASTRRSGLTFSEIHYHPAAVAGDVRNREFVELYNSHPFDEDISGWRLEGEWDLVFPTNTILPAESWMVVAADPGFYRDVHGLTNVVGGLSQRLNNAGGSLRLRKPSGGIVLEVEYAPAFPWPIAADGHGPSLVLFRPSLGEGDPAAWRASTHAGGSPGRPDPVPSTPYDGVRINEVRRFGTAGLKPFVELHNAAPFSREVGGCWIQAGTNPPVQLRPGTTVGARQWLSVEVSGWGAAIGDLPILLLTPDRMQVIDSVEAHPHPAGQSVGRFPDGGRRWGTLSAPGPGRANEPMALPPVVVSEIHYHPFSGDPSEEFMELLNRGGTDLDLAGWEVHGGIRFQFPAGVRLAAGQTVVVARDAATFRSRHPDLPASVVVGNFAGSLSDGGEWLELRRPIQVVEGDGGGQMVQTTWMPLERFAYRDGGRWPVWADGLGSSLERLDPRMDPGEPGAWRASDGSQGSVWTQVELTAVADLAHPSVPAADELQVFLLGQGEMLVDDIEVLAGGRNVLANGGFEGGTGGWIPQGTHRRSTVRTGDPRTGLACLHVIATDRGDHVANRIRRPLSQSIPVGTVVTIRAWVRWLRGHPEILLRLRNGSVEVVGRALMPSTTGSPGVSGSVPPVNAGPSISAVRHEPVLPSPGQPVRVLARVEDPDRVQSVTLRYRVDPATALASVVARDDGEGGDERPADGVFTAQIPAPPQGNLVAFHVVARDGLDAETTFPAQVPDQECLVRFGEPPSPGGLPTYRMWMTAATIARWESREIMSNEGLDVTFVLGTNRVVYNAAARYSGSSYTAGIYNSPVGNLCGYDIAIPDDDRVLGGTRVLLDWPIRDATFLREQLMFWFLERLGLPNMHRRHVHLYVNGLRRGSVYEDIQQPGADTIAEFFPGDEEGSLWKTDCWNEFDAVGNRLDPCLLNTLESFLSGGVRKVARYRWNWRPRAVRGSANDFSDLFALVDALNVPVASLPASVESLVDVDHWMRTFAMNDLASFWDAFGNPNGKNTFLYKPERDRWRLFSWDFDVGLGVFNDPPDAALFDCNDPVLGRLYQSPPLVRKYWAALDEALDGFFQVGPGTQIEIFLRRRHEALRAAGTGPADPAQITAWIGQRRAFLSSQLIRHRAPFAIRTGNGNDFTTSESTISLQGSAPVRVAGIRLNGIDWPIQWSSTTNWSLRLALRPGTNHLVLAGVDRMGVPVMGATDSITILSTGAEPPVARIRINEWLASNDRAVADPADGSFDDWFELFNAGDIPVDLAGYTLTDDLARPGRAVIPPGFVLPAFGTLLVWADGQPEQTRPGATLHVPFQLARAGSEIAVFDTFGRAVDVVRYGPQATDVAEGRWGDGAAPPFLRLAQPTPGAPNALPAPGALQILAKASFDPMAGDLVIGWDALAGRRYRLEWQERFGAGWQSMDPDLTATEGTLSIRVRLGPLLPDSGVYRIRLLP